YEEVESVAAIAAVLESGGIAVETGLYGVETTLQATTGNGNGRTIAILAEYDALPEIGHACGHNLIAAAGVGAFLALDELYRQNPEAVPGTVVLLGTPAEEGHSGKEVMARAGAFDSIDAGVVMAGDRRATHANMRSGRDVRKVYI
ncbi:M20/M25/M40 family metallo-hydrolase, partial [Mycobacterium tuberculosis]|nr:M20/M25/M40 family metallo-hydrolase [Mycobacterium tuberculosis]